MPRLTGSGRRAATVGTAEVEDPGRGRVGCRTSGLAFLQGRADKGPPAEAVH